MPSALAGCRRWDWIYAVALKEFARTVAEQAWYDYEVQAFRVGDVAVLGQIGEPFVEGQL